MKRLFNVAGFTFAVVMDDDHSLWEHIGNYLPFEYHSGQEHIPEEDLLFSLNISGIMNQDDLPTEPYYAEETDRADMPRVTVFKSEDGYSFSMKATASQPDAFLLKLPQSKDENSFNQGILHLSADTKYHKFALDNSLMLMFTIATTGKSVLAMHASVIVNESRGYLFLGESGTGKSTHSRLWLENISGSNLLNDDNPIVRILPDGQVYVYGSPWSGKTPCYKNMSYPVGAMVLIRRCKYNELSRLEFFDAYSALLMSCSGMKFMEKSMDELTDTQSRILESVPFHVMDCLPDAQAAIVCHNGLGSDNC